MESGAFGAWTSAAPSGTGTLAMASGSAQSGSFGIASTVNSPITDGTDEGAAKLTYTEATNKHTWLRAWARFNASTSVGYGTVISKAILYLGATGDAQNRVFWASVVAANQIQFNYNACDTTDTALSSAQTMTVGNWYRWGMHIDRSGANPILQAYLGQTQVATVTDLTTGTGGAQSAIDTLRVGIVHVNQFEKGVYSIDIDDVVIGDSDPDLDIFPAVPLRNRGARVAGWR